MKPVSDYPFNSVSMGDELCHLKRLQGDCFFFLLKSVRTGLSDGSPHDRPRYTHGIYIWRATNARYTHGMLQSRDAIEARLKFVLGLPKWEFCSGKKHFTPGNQIRKNDFAPSEKYSSYASVCIPPVQ